MSTGSGVLRDLVGGPFRRRMPYIVIGVLLLTAVAVIAWVVWSDLTRRGGEGEGKGEREASVAPSLTLEGLGQGAWRVGGLVSGQGGTAYTAKIVDGQSRGVFDLKVDGATGEPIPRGEAEGIGANPPVSGTTPVDEETLRARVSEVLTRLAVGQVKTREEGTSLEVALTYRSKQVATLTVDARTSTVISKGERPPSEGKGQERPEGKKARLVPGNLVQPLGWLAAMIAIVSTLHYSWRRAQTTVIRESQGDAKAVAIRRLRSLLWGHEVFGFLALGLAVLHLVNFWDRLQVSTSWLLFFMMVTVVLSGVFRQVTGRYQLVRMYWRSFHIPYTVLFFAVLIVHVLMKIGELGGD
ncbi:MAG: hypothetical protein HYU29_06435 [Chloroflexi bacterium]|nr:hypothetical protein [Chloroflexota bacterium]